MTSRGIYKRVGVVDTKKLGSNASFSRRDLAHIAGLTPSPEGQLSLLTEGLEHDLASNKYISNEVWGLIWNTDASELRRATATRLITIASTPTRRLQVLSRATLGEVVEAVTSNLPNTDQEMMRQLHTKYYQAGKKSGLEAAIAIGSGFLPGADLRGFLKTVLDYAQDSPESEFKDYKDRSRFLYQVSEAAIVKYDELTDWEVLKMLASTPWSPGVSDSMSLERTWSIIDHRPGIVNKFILGGFDPTIANSIAASRHLFEPWAARLLGAVEQDTSATNEASKSLSFLAIARHPNASFETRSRAYALLVKEGPWELSTEFAKVLESLSPDHLHNSTPWHLLDPDTTEGAIILSGAKNNSRFPTMEKPTEPLMFDGSSSPLTEDYIKNELTPYLDKLGPSSWALFVALLPNWGQSISDLLAVIRAYLA